MIPSTLLSDLLKAIYAHFSSFACIFDLDAFDVKGKKEFIYIRLDNLTISKKDHTVSFDLIIQCYCVTSNDLYASMVFTTAVLNKLLTPIMGICLFSKALLAFKATPLATPNSPLETLPLAN